MILTRAIIRKILRTIYASLLISLFLQGCIISNITYQILVNAFYSRYNPKRQINLNNSKKSFISLLVTIIGFMAPSSVRITTDNASIPKGTFRKDLKTRRIVSSLKSRSIFISNHQIYTDWVFLWWLAYTSGFSGNVIIMLKKSLESLPILGYGMRNYGFIFMNRKWYMDKINLTNRLREMDMNARGIGKLAGRLLVNYKEGIERYDTEGITENIKKWPYCFILFPEGTNMSRNNRAKSYEYARKVGRKPLRNLLLPHVTGLKFALQNLSKSCDCVYDVTVGYSGVNKDTYGEEIYHLKHVILEGKSPTMVDIHIRAFKLSEIPYDDDEKFDIWLHKIWEEKDELMESYYAHGNFNLDPESNHTVVGSYSAAWYDIIPSLVVPAFSTILGLLISIKIVLYIFAE